MLRWLAIEVTRGTANNLFQVATLIRAATALEARVDVLFCDTALAGLRQDAINDLTWSSAYDLVLDALHNRLADAEFVDMARFLRDAKEHGDAVSFWACQESLDAIGAPLDAMAPLLDGARSRADFEATSATADARLRF